MVNIKSIRRANAAFTMEQQQQQHNAGPGEGLVCVFAGATSGIGASTLEKMASLLPSATFYVVGRSESRFLAWQRGRLASLNPKIKVVFFEADVSLLAEVDKFSNFVSDCETKVDYLYMSPGALPFTGAKYTTEGLETCFVLSYYARMRLISNLLPLLNASSRPRVLSVLAGGKEKSFDRSKEDDIGLQRKDNWAPFAAINHTTTMTTMALEHLVGTSNNSKITFMHAHPGLVRTEIGSHVVAPPGSGVLRRVGMALMRWLFNAFMVFGISPEESGERQAYLLMSSSTYGPGTAWRIDKSCEPVTKPAFLARYRADGWPERVWEFTLGVFERALITTYRVK
ncbi:hypothetical protein B0H66DRAFT_467673 [Apodospora peruviana]|uniref:Short-chain dehydrogenase/reductase n=1 Tax=Apodospora peruviana TaxID=516989 RepID=A0AAE0ITP7_9PEZI|nr:hypothetical protein B0H66DRAFT_467673 [Apodospora peruviana]